MFGTATTKVQHTQITSDFTEKKKKGIEWWGGGGGQNLLNQQHDAQVSEIHHKSKSFAYI
jgi:hypothetical protein